MAYKPHSTKSVGVFARLSAMNVEPCDVKLSNLAT